MRNSGYNYLKTAAPPLLQSHNTRHPTHCHGSRADRQTIERRRSKESHRRPRQDCQYRDVRLHLIYNRKCTPERECIFYINQWLLS